MSKIFELPSNLFPFQLSELAESSVNGYRIQAVFDQLSSEKRSAVIRFWVSNKILSPKIAEQRSEEVCYLVTERSSGEVIGVSTLYPDTVGDPVKSVLMMRMFILAKHRGGALSQRLWKKTIVFAQIKLAQRGYDGVVNINENRKLARKGTRQLFERVGYQRVGEWQGQDVWFFEFNKYRFEPKHAST